MSIKTEEIKTQITKDPIVLYMKGSPIFPQCGFSARVVGILDHLSVKYESYDILADEELRQTLKTFSNWPTFPQLYVNGELVGGCDIVNEMFESGELKVLLETKVS